MSNKLCSYTIYPPGYDYYRGPRPTMVGITIKPTPNLTHAELLALIQELSDIAEEMELSKLQPC